MATDPTDPTPRKPRKKPGKATRKGGKRAQQQLELAKRRKDAFQAHIRGATFEQIAKQFGYANKANAWRDIQRVLREVPAPSVTEWRETELNKLNVLEAKFGLKLHSAKDMPLEEQLKRFTAVRSISQDRRALLGLDAPIKHQVQADLDVNLAQLSDADLATIALGKFPPTLLNGTSNHANGVSGPAESATAGSSHAGTETPGKT